MQRSKIQLAELSSCPTRTSENSSHAEIIEVWEHNCLDIERGLAHTSIGAWGSSEIICTIPFISSFGFSSKLETNDRVLTATTNSSPPSLRLVWFYDPLSLHSSRLAVTSSKRQISRNYPYNPGFYLLTNFRFSYISSQLSRFTSPSLPCGHIRTVI